MATFALNQDMTLLEVIKRFDPEGNIMKIAEVLRDNNAFLEDLPFRMANDRITHTSVVRVSQPSGRTRRYNQPVLPSASSTEKNRDVVELLEDWSDLDELLGDQSGDLEALRASEDVAFVEGISQTTASRMVYGNNAVDPDQMTGILTRLDTIDDEFVIDAGGTGSDLSSVVVVQPGVNQVYGVYPKGSQAGIQTKDWGRRIKENTSGEKLAVYTTQFKAHFGLVVENPKCMAAIRNIETSGAVNLFNFEDIIDIKSVMKNGGKGAIIYVNRKIWAQIKKIALNRTNVNLTMDNVFGDGQMPVIDGSPVRLMDALTITEDAIT